jgi:hypothetical protein
MHFNGLSSRPEQFSLTLVLGSCDPGPSARVGAGHRRAGTLDRVEALMRIQQEKDRG